MIIVQVRNLLRQARRLIPDRGYGRDWRLVLGDVVAMRSADALRDMQLVREAILKFCGDWDQVPHLRQAADLIGRAEDYWREAGACAS